MQNNVNLVDLEKILTLKNATTLAVVAVHTAENEPLKNWGGLFSLFSSLLELLRHAPPCSAMPSHAPLVVQKTDVR